jgi:hypothetical protein
MAMPMVYLEYQILFYFVIVIGLVALQKAYCVVVALFVSGLRFEEDVDDVIPLALESSAVRGLNINGQWLPKYGKVELGQIQGKDPDLSPIIKTIILEYTPSEDELQLLSKYSKSLWLNRSLLTVKYSLLYYEWIEDWGSRFLFVVPSSLKQEVMSLCHDIKMSGHLGIQKTIAKVKQSFHWYNLRADVELFVKTCNICSVNKKATCKF